MSSDDPNIPASPDDAIDKARRAAEAQAAADAAVEAERRTQETLARLRSRVTVLEDELQHYREQAGRNTEIAERLVEVVQSREPLPLEPILAGTASDHPMAAVMELSDIHCGEQIQPSETLGFGEFNWAAAQRRIKVYRDKFVGWVNTHRNSFNIPELHIFGKGDYVSGNIHKEYEITNEFPVTVQSVNAGEAIGDLIVDLAAHFHRVVFHGVGADNHGRPYPKPQTKQKAISNYSFIVHAFAKKASARCPNVEFIEATDMKHIANVVGQLFLIEHGDNIKGWAGIPYYGIIRAAMREALRHMREGLRFDFYSLAHFHVPYYFDFIMGNGSVSGTSEFDHAQGRHSAPQQVSFLVHPTYGVFDWTPWRLTKSKRFYRPPQLGESL